MSRKNSGTNTPLAVSYSLYLLVSKVVQPTTATLVIVGVSMLVFKNAWVSIRHLSDGVALQPDPRIMMAGLVAVLFAMSVAQGLLREDVHNANRLRENNARYFFSESIGDLIEIVLMIGALYNLGLLSNLDAGSSLNWAFFYLFFAAWLLLSLIGSLVRNQITHKSWFVGSTDRPFAILRLLAAIAAVAGAVLFERFPAGVAGFVWILMFLYLILFTRRTDDQIRIVTAGQGETVMKDQIDQTVDDKLDSLLKDPENAITRDQINQAIDRKIDELTNDPGNAVTEDKVRRICKSETETNAS